MAKAEPRTLTTSGVRIVTNNRIVYQGQLQIPPPSFFPPAPFPGGNRFIFVVLDCAPEFITDTGTRVIIEPTLFSVGDTVKINVDEIALGPSGDCIVDAAACPFTSG